MTLETNAAVVRHVPPEVFYDHNGPENVADRAGAWRGLRERCPVVHSSAYENGYYVVTGYAEVASALRRASEFLSRDSVTIPSYPTPFGMVQLDPPIGAAFRRAINPWFTAATAEAIRPATRATVAELMDKFATLGTADLVVDLCSPLTAISTMAALGLPLEKFSAYFDLFRRVNAINPLHDSAEAIAAISGEFEQLVAEVSVIVAERYEKPQDDWISVFLGLEFTGRRLRPDEVIANANLFFGGGIDTTAQLTSWTLYHLGKDPELRRRVSEDRSLLRGTFDEFIRFSTPVQGIARTVDAETSVGDYSLEAKKRVFVSMAAANRDPAVFSEPDTIVVTRGDAKRHLGFGVGPHKCLGMHIARVWWEEMVTAVLDRIPDYVIVDDRVSLYPAGAISGMSSLPVTFTPQVPAERSRS
jgi:cytochrome P450